MCKATYNQKSAQSCALHDLIKLYIETLSHHVAAVVCCHNHVTFLKGQWFGENAYIDFSK
jgi:hypothetical protein